MEDGVLEEVAEEPSATEQVTSATDAADAALLNQVTEPPPTSSTEIIDPAELPNRVVPPTSIIAGAPVRYGPPGAPPGLALNHAPTIVRPSGPVKRQGMSHGLLITVNSALPVRSVRPHAMVTCITVVKAWPA